MRYVQEYVLDTPTPEKYPCAHLGCSARAVRVWVVQTELMAAPGFYGECDAHPRYPKGVSA